MDTISLTTTGAGIIVSDDCGVGACLDCSRDRCCGGGDAEGDVCVAMDDRLFCSDRDSSGAFRVDDAEGVCNTIGGGVAATFAGPGGCRTTR